ncbi:MAG TPA: serine hydrolase [Candidatus Limnocylindrales bacterium]|nr:serine hydrolase [Candidatus Limnocylindrales bacterium]
MADWFAPVRERLERLAGSAGLIACGADGRPLFEHDADAALPAASVIKLPLVMALHADAAAGLLDLGEELEVGRPVEGSGLLRHLGGPRALPIRDLATLAVAVSDNTATNRLIERIGLERVNARLDEWGCPRTRLRRAMYDLEARARGRENVLTAREAAALLLRLLRGELVDRRTSDAVLATLERCEDRTLLARYLPREARVAHKSGWIEGVRGDAGIVWHGERAVVVAGLVSGLADPAEAWPVLGLLGWCALRAAGAPLEPLPFELRPGG